MSIYDEYIKRCNDVLGGSIYETSQSLVNEAWDVFQKELRDDYFYIENNADQLSALKNWLVKKKEEREHELAVAQAKAGMVNVSAVSESTAIATADVTLNSTMAQVWALPDNELNIDQKKEISELLQELDNSKDKGESKIVKAAKAVADWAFENAVKAIPTVMPYISQVINGL